MSGEGHRQRQGLPGLLNFALETSNRNGGVQQENSEGSNLLDPARIAWFHDVMREMYADQNELLLHYIDVLRLPTVEQHDALDDDVGVIESALDAITDLVGHIDYANNFHKMNGFPALERILKFSPHSCLRADTARLIAELAQNNPYTQEHLTKEGFIELLAHQMNRDLCHEPKVKAMYAISCITRGTYVPALREFFDKLDGYSLVIHTLQNGTGKLRIKACFYLARLFQDDLEADEERRNICFQIRETFVKIGLVSLLISMLHDGVTDETDEHVLDALVCLIKYSAAAKKEALEIHLGLENLLETKVLDVKDKEQFQEQMAFCFELQELLCFKDHRSCDSATGSKDYFKSAIIDR